MPLQFSNNVYVYVKTSPGFVEGQSKYSKHEMM